MRTKRLTRQERKAATRSALLEAAGRAFARRGFEAASVEEIAEAAGFTRGAFYSNFDSKEELFLELIEGRTAEHLRTISEGFLEGATIEERIRRGGRVVEDLIADETQWCVLYIEFWSVAVRSPKLRKRFAAQYEGWRESIAEMISSQADELGLPLAVPARTIAGEVIALFEGFVLQRLIDPKALPAGFFTDSLARLLAGSAMGVTV